MGGLFVNYFIRFGRVWQVYVQADGKFRTRAENVGLFRVRNADGDTVPLSTMVTMSTTSGPELLTGLTVTGRRKSTAYWRLDTAPHRPGRP